MIIQNTSYYLVGILNSFYQDRGARAVFAMLFNELAEKFPERKLNQLKHLIHRNTYLYAFLKKMCIFYFQFLDSVISPLSCILTVCVKLSSLFNCFIYDTKLFSLLEPKA